MTPAELAAAARQLAGPLAYVGPSGPRNAPLALVGEAGGEDEARAGVPFVGRSGRLLDRWLDATKLDRSELYITNLVKVHPPANAINAYFGPLAKAAVAAAEEAGCLVEELQTSWDSDSVRYVGLTPAGMEWRALLIAELASLPNLRVVVALGGSAAFALTGFSTITKRRGSPSRLVLPGGRAVVVVPTLHPAYVARGQFLASYLVADDLAKARRYRDEGWQRPERDLVTGLGYEELLAELGALADAPTLAWDVETSMDARTLYSLALADSPAHALAVPLTGWTADERAGLRGALAELLARPGRVWVSQNGIFDRFVLRSHLSLDVPDACMADVGYLHSVLAPEFRWGLDVLASRYTDEPFWKEDGKTSRRTGDWARFLEYNARDAAVTLECWQAVQARLAGDRDAARLRATYQFHIDQVPAFLHFMERGFAVDRVWLADEGGRVDEALAAKITDLNALLAPKLAGFGADAATRLARLESLRERLNSAARVARRAKRTPSVRWEAYRDTTRKEIGRLRRVVDQLVPPDNGLAAPLVNPNSDVQTRWYFYEFLGIPAYKAPGGAETVDDTALARLAVGTAARAGLPEARLMQDYRSLVKYRTEYVGMELSPDGRYRFSMKPRGTMFGRQSSAKAYDDTGAPVQTLPEAFRRALVPDEGCVLIEIDKSGAEWVVVAHESGDPNMLRAVRAGADPHAYTASLMSGLSLELVLAEARVVGHSTTAAEVARLRATAPELAELRAARPAWWPLDMSLRQAGKKANHGLNYDEGIDTFALTNGMARAEAARVRTLYRTRAYPGVVRWHQRIQFELRASRPPRLANAFGRVWVVQNALDAALFRQAYSFKPQSTVVDMVNAGLVLLYSEWRARHSPLEPLAQRHDSLVFQAPLTAAAALPAALEAACAAISPEVPSPSGPYRIANEITIGWNGAEMTKVTPDGVTAWLERAQRERLPS